MASYSLDLAKEILLRWERSHQNFFVESQIVREDKMGLALKANCPATYFEKVIDDVVARGGASYTALRCNLHPLEFSLEDWVSSETIEEANRAFIRLVAKDYNDSVIRAAEDPFITEIHEYLSSNNYAAVKKLWYRGKNWRVYYDICFPPDVVFPTAEGLSQHKIRSCIKAAMQMHLKLIPKIKAAWLKANLPVGMY